VPALTHSPADIISRVLIELNLGSDPGDALAWPVYVAEEPMPSAVVPDELIVVTDTTGTNDGRAMPTGERQEHHGIQVKVRARIHPTGWERAELICEAMNEQILRRVVTVDASVYLVQCVAGVRKVHEFKRDPKSELRYYSLNGLVSVTKTSA
jgi:hypothetical protein